MSEPKLISPLLDGFSMGATMCEHDGIRCCPAIKEHTDKKYIVKIITIPASQVQMDALLLAGAYKDPADVMDYFKEVGEDVMKEAELLKKLSKLAGFLPYEGWQMVPITKRRLGYEVYLISSYKRSLDKYVRRNPVTHLEAINLGLDLCTALSVCRQAGALYVDLKPTNIFVSDKKEYKIGDLGFIMLDALKYTTLPDKYQSVYTPPELSDPMESVNLTTDTYAVGMILYQLYNEGQLPPSLRTPDSICPPPINADYELSEIIMKAIHPDINERWNDPKLMGQALASYMQRNTINDVPITPHTPLEINSDGILITPKADDEQIDFPVEAEDTDNTIVSVDQPVASLKPDTAESTSDETDLDAVVQSETANGSDAKPDTRQTDCNKQTLEISDDLSRIIAKADDLIAHETPEGVVLPEIPDLPDPFAFIAEDSDEIDDSDIPVDPIMDEKTESNEGKDKRKRTRKFASQKGKQIAKKLLSACITIIVLCAIGMGAFWYYQNIYLQSINKLTIDGSKDQLIVTIDSDADPSLISVTCSDNYGNSFTQTISDKTVTFTDLLPDTMYRIELSIDGFHKLVGQTSDVFTTDTTTSIVTFTSITGSEDGSVMLSFTVDGEEPDEWTVVYSTEGEEEQRKHFNGHAVNITGLSVGKVYTFTLNAGDKLSLSGTDTLEVMASRLILAEDLTITSSGGSDMTVHWNAPGDIVIDSWNVRCYNESGYEEQVTVTDTQVLFTGIDPTESYNVEVTASGMTQPARTSITANPINITQLHVDESNEKDFTVTWDYVGSEPEDGWLLMYTIDGSDSKNVVKCEKASAKISPRIPGAKYEFTIQSTNGVSIFNNVNSFKCTDAESFDSNSLAAENIDVMLLKTPDDKNWRYETVSKDAFTDQFHSGDSISIVLHGKNNFYLPGTKINILYVIRDAHGNVLPDLISKDSDNWKDIWYGGDYHYGELKLPVAPTSAGEYVLNIYFDYKAVAEVSFTITQ